MSPLRGQGGRPSPFRSLIGTPELSVLAEAFGIKGGLADPSVLRSDAGVYLQVDTYPLLQLRETELGEATAVVTANGNADTWTDVLPSMTTQIPIIVISYGPTSTTALATGDVTAALLVSREGSPEVPIYPLKIWSWADGTLAWQGNRRLPRLSLDPAQLPVYLPPRTNLQYFVRNGTGTNHSIRHRMTYVRARTSGIWPVAR